MNTLLLNKRHEVDVLLDRDRKGIRMDMNSAFFIMQYRHENNWTCDLLTLINSRTNERSVGLQCGDEFRHIDLPNHEIMWLIYSRKVTCLTYREFIAKWQNSMANCLLAIYESKVIDTNRTFILTDDCGCETKMSERDLEYYVNLDEPHSNDWTPYFCTEDMNEMREAIEGTNYVIIKEVFND